MHMARADGVEQVHVLLIGPGEKVRVLTLPAPLGTVVCEAVEFRTFYRPRYDLELTRLGGNIYIREYDVTTYNGNAAIARYRGLRRMCPLQVHFNPRRLPD